jgi:hypothetical protein
LLFESRFGDFLDQSRHALASELPIARFALVEDVDEDWVWLSDWLSPE